MEKAAGKLESGHHGKALTSPDPWLPVPAVITDVLSETYDTRTYTLVFKDPRVQQAYSFRPGQFNMLGILGIGEAPLSLSSDPGVAGAFQHTIRAIGDVTRALARLQVGDKVAVRGPFGSGWPMEEAKGKDLLIMAGGIGLPPLRPVIEQALRRRGEYGQVTILYGARTPDDLVHTADFDRWSSEPDTYLGLTVDRAGDRLWARRVGVVPVLLEEVSLAPERTVAMICGPEIMMRFAVADLLKRGIPPERILFSLERRMRCGVAQCGHCFLGPKFVCQDGPVFRYAQLYGLLGKGV